MSTVNRHWRMRKKFLIFVATFLCGAIVGLAQETGSGTIQGTVGDQSGAVIPSASVTLTQTATGLTRTTKTNGAGFYVFQALILGPYSITVAAPGMQTYVGTLTLQAGQTAQVDVGMQVGSSATKVTVSANVTPLVDTTSGTLAETVEFERIEQMPLNGRDVTSLVLITAPGVQNKAGHYFAANGIIRSTSMTQDGATLSNLMHGGYSDKLPGLDSIAEFKVETGNSSAKMETPATIILTTQHGTNGWHGSAFDTNRSSSYGVARRREDYYDKTPFYLRNEFGASLGGPVRIPKLYDGRDKTFFFFSYEGNRVRQNSTVETTVPTAAMRQGNFSGLNDSSGRCYQLYNPYTSMASWPWTRQPFGNGKVLDNGNCDPGNNLIDPSLESPVAKWLYEQTPLPTFPNVNPMVTNNFYGAYPNNTNEYTTALRLDHSFSEKDQAFIRFTHGMTSNISAASGLGPATEAFNLSFNTNLYKGQDNVGAVGWTHLYSPTFFGQTLFTYGRDYLYMGQYSVKNWPAVLGLPNPNGYPCFSRITSTQFDSYDCGSNPESDNSIVLTIEEDLTKTIGRHELQFGGEIASNRLATNPGLQEESGGVDFASGATALFDSNQLPNTTYNALGYTGANAANMYLGVGTYNTYANRNWYFERNTQRILYFQDNFHWTPRLNLNMGVRYEYSSPIHEMNDSLVSFNPATGAAVIQTSIARLEAMGDVNPTIFAAYQAIGLKIETPAQAGLPQNLVNSNPYDFNPRLGFAYRLTMGEHYSVLRGGYGMYSYPDELNAMMGLGTFTAPTTGFLFNNPNSFVAQSPDGLPNYLLRQQPNIIAGVNSANALDNAATSMPPGSASAYWPAPNYPTSRAEQWNLTYQKEIAANTALTLSYVGTHAFRIPQMVDYASSPSPFAWYLQTGQPYPEDYNMTSPYNIVHNSQTFGPGMVQEVAKTGWSNANSFQIELQRQYSKGYAYQIFYVLDNAFRAAGQNWSSSYIMPGFIFPPGTIPGYDSSTDTYTDLHAVNKVENYQRDTLLPQHQVNWNWIVDLPFGRGKRFGSNAHGFLNQLIGGWQLAGAGTWYSRWLQPNGYNWGPFTGFKTYGKHKVQDCTSGTCFDRYLWFNGYLDANVINQPGGITGVPSNYQPYEKPLIPLPAGGVSATDPLAGYYDTNSVCVNVAGRTYTTLAAGDPCLSGTSGYSIADATVTSGWWENRTYNPYHFRQVLRGPNEWNMDASLFKTFSIRERARLEFKVDAFNVFNRPGTNMPSSSSGLIDNTYSDNAPRILQLTLRLSW